MPSQQSLFLPVEWSEVCVVALPAWFAQGVDDKWNDHDDYAADDKYRHPCLRVSGGYLCRWDKAEYEGEQ